MRKIEREMIAAINALRHNAANASWQRDNTTVTNHDMPGGQATEIMLHGNHIATVSESGNLHVCLAGWNTRTTRSRLSALIVGLARIGRWEHGMGVSSAKGVPYLHDATGKHRISETEWHSVSLTGDPYENDNS